MTTRILIIGAGLSGLLANYVLSGFPNVETTVVQRGYQSPRAQALQTGWNSGPPRFIPWSDEFAEMLDELEIGYSQYRIESSPDRCLAGEQVKYCGAEEEEGIVGLRTDTLSLVEDLCHYASPVYGDVTRLRFKNKRAGGEAELIDERGHLQDLPFDGLVFTGTPNEGQRLGLHSVTYDLPSRTVYQVHLTPEKEAELFDVACIRPESSLVQAVTRLRPDQGLWFVETYSSANVERVVKELDDLIGTGSYRLMSERTKYNVVSLPPSLRVLPIKSSKSRALLLGPLATLDSSMLPGKILEASLAFGQRLVGKELKKCA